MKITGEFTTLQLNTLRAECGKIERIDPCSQSYRRLIDLLGAMNQNQLKQVRDAKIPFMSLLAINRIKSAA